MHPALLNGHPRVTIIESFMGNVYLVKPGEKIPFSTLREAQEFAISKGWEINISIIMGSSITREIAQLKEK